LSSEVLADIDAPPVAFGRLASEAGRADRRSPKNVRFSRPGSEPDFPAAVGESI